MDESTTSSESVFTRLNHWFHRTLRKPPANGASAEHHPVSTCHAPVAVEHQSASNDQTPPPLVQREIVHDERAFDAVRDVQSELHRLKEASDALQESLQTQRQRQDETLAHLTALPDLLQAVPDKLGSLDGHLRAQNERQDRMDDVLARLAGVSAEQRRTLDSLTTAISALADRHDNALETISGLRQQMLEVGQQAEASGSAIRRVEENLRQRESQTDTALHRQTQRVGRQLTAILVLVIVLLLAVIGAGAWLVANPR